MLTLAAAEDMEVHHMDVSSTFLNGDLEEETYMAQPEGFAAPGQEHLVCCLKKSIYGLKQSPWQWYKKLHLTFLALGFAHCVLTAPLKYLVAVRVVLATWLRREHRIREK